MESNNNKKPIIGEIGFANLSIVISLILLVMSLQIFVDDVALDGPGAMPVLVSSLMIVMSLLIRKEAVRVKKNDSKSETTKKNTVSDTFKFLFPKEVVITIGSTLLYIIGLFNIGFEISTVVFLFALFTVFKATSWKKSLLISVLTTIAFIIVFGTIFKVILP